jgi:hypothetical protein
VPDHTLRHQNVTAQWRIQFQQAITLDEPAGYCPDYVLRSHTASCSLFKPRCHRAILRNFRRINPLFNVSECEAQEVFEPEDAGGIFFFKYLSKNPFSLVNKSRRLYLKAGKKADDQNWYLHQASFSASKQKYLEATQIMDAAASNQATTQHHHQ